MAYQFSRKGCFKCGNLGHIAENCSSEQRLCYNCRQPGHESSACPSPRTASAKQCYNCGGVGHIVGNNSHLVSNYLSSFCSRNCGRFGHIARVCPNGAAGGAFSARPGRGLNTSALPPIVCFKCGLLNHRAKLQEIVLRLRNMLSEICYSVEP
ncbi:hypothetical protein F5878DRAFT_669337 [Lentinula raphanica]|uniref:CCHC-type domain-containing protein n=1 Tax=Lentinula raphanica TaxID=153919 RepID=A0AA38PEK0_9AGAR|nr:hypothetical protein F5878DRAFT_669337 [Lentinula raphanica]